MNDHPAGSDPALQDDPYEFKLVIRIKYMVRQSVLPGQTWAVRKDRRVWPEHSCSGFI